MLINRINDINLLYPPFMEKVKKGLRAAIAAKIPIEIFETYRTNERQNYLFEQGRTRNGAIITNRRGGLSWHNYGLAVDVVMRVDGRYNWDNTLYYTDAAQYFEAQGLRWAGHSGFELVHYELPINYSVDESHKIVEQYGMLYYWKLLNDYEGENNV
jgi:peptidoglycan L-alanyl-D-glutamate endopeptidase CwlK